MTRHLVLLPLLKVLSSAIVMLLLWLGVSWGAAWHYRRRLERVAGADFPTFLRRWPRTTANESARRLEELARPLGISVAPPRSGRDAAEPACAAATKRALEPLKLYFEHLLMRADELTPPPPSAASRFAAEHHLELVSIRAQLLSSPDPVWEFEPGDLLEGPVPNLLGLMSLHKLMAVEAIESSAKGDADETLGWLEALWRIERVEARGPQLVSLLIAVPASKTLHRLARTLPQVPAAWAGRLSELRPRARLVSALELEAAMGWSLDSRNLAGLGDMGPVTRGLLGAYMRASACEHAERELRLARAHAALGVCDLTEERIEELWRNERPWWNVLGKSLWLDVKDLTRRVLRLELDQELTELVLRARAGEVLPPRTPAAACPGSVWLFEVLDGGRFSIRLDPRLEGRIDGTLRPLPLIHHGRLP